METTSVSECLGLVGGGGGGERGTSEAGDGGASLRSISHDIVSSSYSLESCLDLSCKEHPRCLHFSRALPALLVPGKAMRCGRK